MGLLGTDGTTRSLPALLAKARGLREEEVTAFVSTGSYRVPVDTFTGDVTDDLVLIDECVGVGEIAIADHRSSQPTYAELARIAAASRRGGLLSGKAGLVQLHVGDGSGRLDMLDEVARLRPRRGVRRPGGRQRLQPARRGS